MIHLINSPEARLNLIKETIELPGSSCWKAVDDFTAVLQDYNYEKHPFNFKLDGVIRASVNDDENWFNDIDRLSYPNRNKYKKIRINFGRCNFPDTAVFYCSSENGVPVFEVRPEVGQYIVLSNWASKVSDKIEFYGAAIGVEAIIKSLGRNDSFIKTLSQDDIFKDSTTQDIKNIDRYVAKLFMEKASENDRIYWLTSAITRIHFENMVLSKSGKKLQGLIYPSVASMITGSNLALTTSYVDQNLRLIGASMYKLVEHDVDKMEYKLTPVKTLMRADNYGLLDWQDISKRHAGKYYILSPQTPTIPFDKSTLLDREEKKY